MAMLYYKPKPKIMILSTPIGGDNFWEKYYATRHYATKENVSFTPNVNDCPHCEDEKIKNRFEILDIR